MGRRKFMRLFVDVQGSQSRHRIASRVKPYGVGSDRIQQLIQNPGIEMSP